MSCAVYNRFFLVDFSHFDATPYSLTLTQAHSVEAKQPIQQIHDATKEKPFRAMFPLNVTDALIRYGVECFDFRI